MNSELKDTIKERFDKLPIEVMAAIRNFPWVEKMQNIARDNKLDEQKEKLFITETILVVSGAVLPKTYPLNLAENVGLDDDTVIKIAKEVDEQIIAPIMKVVEKNDSDKKMGEPIEKTEPYAPISTPKVETEEPIVITAETKEEALKELSRRSMKNQNPPVLVPELVPSNLPMIEPPSAQGFGGAKEGEAAHDVAQAISSNKEDGIRNTAEEQKPKVPLPDYRYEGGKDPYREPLG